LVLSHEINLGEIIMAISYETVKIAHQQLVNATRNLHTMSNPTTIGALNFHERLNNKIKAYELALKYFREMQAAYQSTIEI